MTCVLTYIRILVSITKKWSRILGELLPIKSAASMDIGYLLLSPTVSNCQIDKATKSRHLSLLILSYQHHLKIAQQTFDQDYTKWQNTSYGAAHRKASR